MTESTSITPEEDGEYVSYVDADEALAAFLDVLIGVKTINEAMHSLGFETRGSEDIFNRLATGEVLPAPSTAESSPIQTEEAE